MSDSNRKSLPVPRVLRRVGAGAKNALTILKRGRLGAPYRASFDVVRQERTYALRHYHGDDSVEAVAPVLLVPPLMVTSEIYDISPELSAINFLGANGMDVWLCDYGNPLAEDDGLERTLDDHILAVDDAIETVARETGQKVHLLGYSQGGMFCYQAAGYRRAKDIGSIITFGSPVDIRKNLPVRVHDDIAARLIKVARQGLKGPIEDLDGLPGWLTSRGFKLLNPQKELGQILDFFGLLHDRDALEQREPKRLFLGGDGFVHWPGEALRDFIDQVIVQNRMASGGFVVDGRTFSLSDIDAPILYFVGQRDDLARPAAVRAIERAAPDTETHGVDIPAGHFGLVVGSTAMGTVWPTVVDWVRWKAGAADDKPELLRPQAERTQDDAKPVDPQSNDDSNTRMLYDLATELADGLWHKLGDVSRDFSNIVDTVRWQLPRLAQLENLDDGQPVNIGLALEEQAHAIPDKTFFLWDGRAFTYAQANRRVNQLLSAMVDDGAKPGQHIGVLMDNHPDLLTAVAAINRLGAVAVLLNSGLRGVSLTQALEAANVEWLVCDPAHVDTSRTGFDAGPIGVLGAHDEDRPLPDDVIDLEANLDPQVDAPPEGIEANAGLAGDLAMLIFTSGTTGLPKPAKITNRRWAMAALGAAAACMLSPKDTVYCALPLYHATGLLVGCGGALIGGARLALAREFSVRQFWSEVRRYGATVVFYVGEMCRYLVSAPEQPNEHRHPVRMFVGNGMRAEVWNKLVDRFGRVRVLEFYGSTEGNVVLANFGGEKAGSVGRPLPGTDEITLVRYDAASGQPLRDDAGRLRSCGDDEPGLLLARISDSHPLAYFDGYLDAEQTEQKIIRDGFHDGDAWFNTGDVLRRDADGDFWFVDRVGDTFRWHGENVSTQQVAQVLDEASFCKMTVVYGVEVPGYDGRAGMAAMVLDDDAEFDGDALFALVDEHLFPAAHPRFVRLVDALEHTDSFKFITTTLRDEGANPTAIDDPIYVYDADARTYRPLTPDAWVPEGL
ncbi:long-chain-acyl-CoA synthetase [Persicimonas caeni]|uniref:Long-chain-acyl-CoA synthetase n=1 Tax=Persicimonas caeni TaxID=2292766 RepID=A0A4Y6PMV8_PERCE|nr:AMP-binding protein [Persicimonas caeni]QDG49580.1 long-chain-acyl-CoA synthetase [Persicimonas caeni]QED30801.1 long-chain-acyl-CoA synthetase [Persicimonas caeni]